jgi:hypothetical protein
VASTYNGSVANLVDPLANSPLNSPSHSTQHTEINDALQTLGVYQDISSSVTFSGFTKGNATVNARYAQANKWVHFWGNVTLGSTSSMAGPLDVGLPVTARGAVLTNNSACSFYNNATLFWGMVLHISTTGIRLVAMNAAGTYVSNADIGASVPFTWANTHSFYWNHIYEAA